MKSIIEFVVMGITIAVVYLVYVFFIANSMPKATGEIDELIISVGRSYGDCEYRWIPDHCERATGTYNKLRSMIVDGRLEGDADRQLEVLDKARSAAYGRWRDTEWIRNITERARR